MMMFGVLHIGKIALFTSVLTLALCSASLAQTEAEQKTRDARLPEKIDEFGRVGECDFSGRLDVFLTELRQRPTFQGYVINYLSADTLPGDRENFARGRMVVNHIAFRNFDRSRLTIVRGGYRPDVATELWLIPPGADPPEPSGTVAEPKIPKNKTFLFDKNLIGYDEGDNLLDEFVLSSIKEREQAEMAVIESEAEGERSEDIADPDSPIADVEVSEFVDERTQEEKQADRFQWANTGFGRVLTKQKNDRGVLIFYADDQRYDIGKLHQFIEQARNLLAERSPIKAERLRIEFGGYRHEPQVEFWVVSSRGKAPVAEPDERPAEPQEEPEN